MSASAWAHEEPAWRCRCGLPWSAPAHVAKLRRTTNGFWRGEPFALDALKQWLRENMPAGRDGFVHLADDSAICSWEQPNRYGIVGRLEWKSRNAALDHGTAMVLRAEAQPGCRVRPLAVQLDGDVPTRLHHWPLPCPCCGAPGPAEPSTRCRVSYIGSREHRVIAPEKLRGFLLRHISWRPRSPA